MIFNASSEAREFELPMLAGGRWRRVLDTADEAGRYLLDLEAAPTLREPRHYSTQPHSMVVLCCP